MSFLKYLDKTIVASKYFSTDEMTKIYNLGARHFGENYVQSLLDKKSSLKDLKDISWHLIGHLQSNKTKLIINEIDYLHTLDSIKLASIIQKYRNTPLNCFIQINLEKNDNKEGILIENLDEFIQEIKKYDKINLIGFMAIGAIDDVVRTEEIFKTLNDLKIKYNLNYTSMGMSNDYELALKYHSDFLRIGSLFKGVI
ncbi:YggS family pyridoxal phosphate-dependent enzyme [Acholeplasma laidlawii]|uniref:YggS family pyridoxal phosphate-dependent enzyme n=1 Tax=Acholeplasma laidlawii TaxID=2148 RepID=UPI0018C2E560|nr:YggS family pyridoxal phosphate-dependent enzyme [Acholeplasma laidlawii]MBG0762092.1 YggS family pyridoxal phosphate-dependent enzyme [Acholeplasma laidlawii]